ncbi:MAG: ribonuclease R [Solobacterium sp.]|jgi:ribonuclease R|nr:ribonuclease R [Solobacterium sp.]MCH4222449.1 ribonuclease R [Solobacterium sp.]MCH4265849.1 ribonuclease R [Solobacterium sp.]
MNELKDKILECINHAKKGTMTRKKIAKAVGAEKSMDLIALGKALEEMENDFVLVRDAGNCYETPEQAGFMTGKLSINRKGLGFIDREGEDSIVIQPEDQADALDGDTVLLQDGGMGYGRVKKVIARATTHVVGTFTLTPHGLQCVADDEKIDAHGTNVRCGKDFKPTEGLKVLLSIERYGTPLILRVERVIGFKDDPGVDILSILLDHDIEPEFPQEVMDNANAVAVEVSEADRKGRRDLTNEVIVTIDGDDSKDFDDAVGVKAVPEGWDLIVSIADVEHYVTAGSPLDQEAFKRGTSTYAVNTVVPMLPHVLSNGICSLNPHEERLTNTCEMIVAKDGTIVSYEIYPSVMRSTERMTYNNVNKILNGDEEVCAQYAHLGDLFTTLRDCADAIRRNRHEKGAIDFDSTESVIKVDEQGHPVDIFARVQGHAEAMIEDCMIAANVSVADFMNKHQLPCVYRIHEEPQARRMKEFEQMSYLLGHKFILPKGNLTPKQVQQYLEECSDEEQYPVLSKLLLRCMQKAKYDPKCLGHFGLAETEYLHFTSPIRRYPDLCVHRMLRKYVFDKCEDANETLKDESFVQAASEQSSIRERASQDAEWAATDMKKAEYMEDRVGTTAEGIISSVTSFGFFVQLDNTVEGLIRLPSLTDDYYKFDQQRYMLVGERTRKQYAVGQKVNIIVLSADKGTSTIEFGIARTGIRRSREDRPQRGGSYGHRDDRGASRGGRSSGGDHKRSYGARNSQGRGRPSYGSRPYDQKRSFRSPEGADAENTYQKPRTNRYGSDNASGSYGSDDRKSYSRSGGSDRRSGGSSYNRGRSSGSYNKDKSSYSGDRKKSYGKSSGGYSSDRRSSSTGSSYSKDRSSGSYNKDKSSYSGDRKKSYGKSSGGYSSDRRSGGSGSSYRGKSSDAHRSSKGGYSSRKPSGRTGGSYSNSGRRVNNSKHEGNSH